MDKDNGVGGGLSVGGGVGRGGRGKCGENGDSCNCTTIKKKIPRITKLTGTGAG